MAPLSRKEVDEMKPEIEKVVNKFLGFTEMTIVTTATNCILLGYSENKTAGELKKLKNKIIFNVLN